MRVVVTSFGSEGDTRPLLALADGLTRRGHPTVACLDRSGHEGAARLGVEYRELLGDMRSHMYGGRGEQALARATADGGFTGLRLFGDLARAHSGAWIDTIADAARSHRADVIIGCGLTVWAAQAAAELTGKRLAVGSAFPVMPTREFPIVVAPGRPPSWLNLASHHVGMQVMWSAFRGPINRARRARGLGRFRAMWDQVPVVYGISPSVLPPPRDWGSGVRLCGDWHLDDPAFVPPSDLAAFLDAGEPPAYVGFGSMVGTNDVIRTILAGLGHRRVLLAPGWDAAALGSTITQSSDVHVVGHTPHRWLLPRCAFAIHHCGAGTTHAAARAGIPSIPVPFAADQPFWARRLADIGVGTSPLDRRRMSVADVRTALAQAEHPTMLARARDVAAEMAREDSVGAVVDHLASWSTSSRRRDGR